MLDPVEGARDRRGGAELRLQDDDVVGRGRSPSELRQDRGQRLARIDPPTSLGECVAGTAERVVRLLEPELADVARDRRLSYDAARGLERREQLELGADPAARDDASDQSLPLRLAERCRLRLHRARIVIQCFARPQARARSDHAAQAALDRPVRRFRGRCHDRGAARSLHRLPHRHGRGATGKEMNKVDQTIDRAADWLQRQADLSAGQPGVKAKLAQGLADDADLLRKLKPSLIAARARGEAPTDRKPGQGTVSPTAPQLGPRPKPPGKEGPNPWLVVGAALVTGVFIAKWIDWRGHAHPRR